MKMLVFLRIDNDVYKRRVEKVGGVKITLNQLESLDHLRYTHGIQEAPYTMCDDGSRLAMELVGDKKYVRKWVDI